MDENLTPALDFTREAIIILDSNFDPVLINPAACKIIGIEASADEATKKKAAERFVPFVRSWKNDHAALGAEAAVRRVDGQIVPISLSIAEFERPGEEPRTVISFYDLSEIRGVGTRIVQLAKVRSLLLLAVARALKDLHKSFDTAVYSPLERIRAELADLPPQSSLMSTISTLLEALDPVLNPNVAIKVRIAEDLKVSASWPEVFRLLGEIMLAASDFCGSRGEVVLRAESFPPDSIMLEVRAEAKHRGAFHSALPFRELLIPPSSVEELEQDKLVSGLDAAREILKRWESSLSIVHVSETTMVIEITLPAQI